jgi:hypothetical protein
MGRNGKMGQNGQKNHFGGREMVVWAGLGVKCQHN